MLTIQSEKSLRDRSKGSAIRAKKDIIIDARDILMDATTEIRPGNPGKQKTLRGEDLPTKALNEFFTAV